MNDISDPPALTGPPWPPPWKKIIGITGSRRDPLTDERQATLLMRGLTGFKTPRGFVTGACVGVDHRAGVFLARAWPDVPHLVLVPADRSRVRRWWEEPPPPSDRAEAKITVRDMPPGSSYADRNAAIVDTCDVLVGFPAHDEDHPGSRRSGSWQTIRLARAVGKMIFVFPLDAL